MQKGSKSKGMNLADVAKLHGMTAQELMPQLRKGIKHEYEHTTSRVVARRTALDHLVEFPDYYDRLEKIEKMHLGGDMSMHLAPNGEHSNLTHEQWHLVRTPEFKAWFGDWENDHENASKVVDENGEPLIVYHGSRAEGEFYTFEHIEEEKLDWTKDSFGFYFTNDLEYAKGYGEKIYKCFLNIRNPKISNNFEHTYLPYHKINTLINNGYDGMYFDGNIDEDIKGIIYEKEIIAFYSNQIKLADGSNSTFDGDNPDIRFDKGGEIENLIDQGEIELKVYPTTPKHANLYGLKSENPLYIQSIFISENQRLKGIGKKVLKYLNDFAIENGHDVMFGHITQKASFSKDDSRQSNLDDVAMIKNWLQSNGYEICEGNNDFYKVVNNPDIRFEKGGLIAPNGKPSNLTQEQWKLVRTPEFKAWFGDWENDPKNASKVVDENGEPLVLWHYAKTLKYELDKFYIFNVDKQLGSHFGSLRQSQKIKYPNQIIINEEPIDFKYYQVFLNIRNPIRLKDVGIFESDTLIDAIGSENIEDDDWNYLYDFNGKSENTYVDRVKFISKSKFGYDGAVYLNRYESDAKTSFIISLDEVSDKIFKNKVPSAEDSWIAFEPNQIKLADGSNTTFDGSNPDIRFKRGGRTISQTPAPLSERIYGSKTNPKGSAASKVNRITFTTQLTKSIKNKVDEHNEEYPENKVTLATAKAVVRRGMGAYSKSHRPTISGGMPNSRQAWGLARLNKFLMKKSGQKVKKSYIQDDDLL